MVRCGRRRVDARCGDGDASRETRGVTGGREGSPRRWLNLADWDKWIRIAVIGRDGICTEAQSVVTNEIRITSSFNMCVVVRFSLPLEILISDFE